MAWRIPCTPIPDSGIPNSEIRMAYARSGIPHHEIAGLGGRTWAGWRGVRGAGDGGSGHRMSNANSGVGHSMSDGVSWLPSVKSGSGTMGEGRKEPTLGTDPRERHTLGGDWPTRKTSGQAASGLSGHRGKQKAPRGFLGAWRGLEASYLRARTEREAE